MVRISQSKNMHCVFHMNIGTYLDVQVPLFFDTFSDVGNGGLSTYSQFGNKSQILDFLLLFTVVATFIDIENGNENNYKF